MSEVTVTMPLREYEKLKADIKYLESQKVNRFIKTEYTNFEKNEYVQFVDFSKLMSEGFRVSEKVVDVEKYIPIRAKEFNYQR